MTREEAIRELKRFSGTTQLKLSANFWNALGKAINALEQQPCDDAISRKWVLDVVNNFVFDTETDRNRIIHIIRDTAPSVTPKQKTGKWIYDENGMDWNLAAWKCSECHVQNMNIPPNMKFGKNEVRKIANPLMFQGSKFCPNCGAKMENEV